MPQARTVEISERLDYAGEVVEPLDEDDVRAAIRRLKAEGVSAVAVCYLFGFRNPDHEERTARIVEAEAPEWRVSLASRVLPTIREYPRLSTTVIDACVGPIVETYLTRLADELMRSGVTTPQLFLMQSNGGLMRIDVAARFPNQTLLSGPAVVTIDMGGTSTDIGVISGGRAEETGEGRVAGQDIGAPMLAIRTLGAGGGAIAWIGKDGLLKVGPQSAGAVPGPACYGNGGERPTVTDANLLLGALGAENILGGRMPMDRDRARGD